MILFLILLIPSFCGASKMVVFTPLKTVSVESFSREGAVFVKAPSLLEALGFAFSFEDGKLRVGKTHFAAAGDEKGRKDERFIFFKFAPVMDEGSLYMALTDFMRWLDLEGTHDPERNVATLRGKVLSFTRHELDGGIAFALKASAPFTIKPFFLPSPVRFVIDARPLTFPFATRRESLNFSHFQSLRVSQFQTHPDWITRIVVDEDKTVTPLMYWEDNQRTLVIAFLHQVEEIRWEEDEESLNITASFTGPLSVSSFALSHPHRIVVDLSSALLGRKNGQISVNRGRVKEIRFSQFQLSPSIVRIVVDLVGSSQYEVIPGLNQVTVAVSKKYVPLVGAVVVVDAGHGGSDPGAKSSWGLVEKEVNLEIAEKLGSLLEESGLSVLQIRDGDYFVPLYDRPKIANEAGAVLFISIHSNALPSRPETRGFEVYYFNDYSMDLAREIHQAMEESQLPLPSRGIKKAGFVVIKYTRMPAVLVEVAYLTNKQDSALLGDGSFRDRVALSIKKGILSYLEKYPPTFQKKAGDKLKRKMDTMDRK